MTNHDTILAAASHSLRELLRTAVASGYNRVGQVSFEPHGAGFELRHMEDGDKTDL